MLILEEMNESVESNELGKMRPVSMEERVEIYGRAALKVFGSINWGDFARNSQTVPDAAERLAAYRATHAIPENESQPGPNAS